MSQQDHALELLDSIYRGFCKIDRETMELALNNLLSEIEDESDGTVSDSDWGKIQLFQEVIAQLNETLSDIQDYGND